MKSITIQGSKRESVGKASSKAIRDAEQVPCVVYGAEQPIHFQAETASFRDLVYTPDAHTVSLDIAGVGNIKAILQDMQFHPVSDKILHADFYQLNDNKPVTLEVPVKLTGRSKGVVRGGALLFSMRKLSVKALPANLPDEIIIDITKLDVGGKIYIETLRTEAYELMHPDNAVIVAVKRSRNMSTIAMSDDDEEGE